MSSLGTPRQQYRLGDVLRAARVADARFKRQEQLARHLAWPVKRVHQLEIGHLRPTDAEFAALRQALPLFDVLLRAARRPEPADTVVAGRR